MNIDPITGLNLAKTAADLMGKLYAVQKEQSNTETKQKLDEVIDELRTVKKMADELEDENRTLRESLRFKGDDFELKNPFWYEKKHPDQPLCAKCFASDKVGPMSEEFQQSDGIWRRCLVWSNTIQLEKTPPRHVSGGPSGRNNWMA